MKVTEMIEFLQGLKYDDFEGERELNEKQVSYNGKMDNVIKFLFTYKEIPNRDNDPDCPTGACPIR